MSPWIVNGIYFQLPHIETSSWFIASSYGLVCFMDNKSRTELYVCNLVTKTHRKLVEPSGQKFSDYGALAISVDSLSHSYTVAIVKSKQVPKNFVQWNVSIHFYSSEFRYDIVIIQRLAVVIEFFGTSSLYIGLR